MPIRGILLASCAPASTDATKNRRIATAVIIAAGP
jgi:hypothetical protein